MQLAAAQTFGPSNSIAPSAPSSPRSIRSPPEKELALSGPASDSISYRGVFAIVRREQFDPEPRQQRLHLLR
jgi:hypothetical protein